MVTKESVDEQLKNLGFNLNGWGRAEIRELPHILLPGEEIYELVNGTYEGGFALAVATDARLLLVDKKPMNYLTVEDIRFDMISEIDYSHRLLGAQINISTGLRDLRFRSYNQSRLRKLIGHVQHCMDEGKKQQSQRQVVQNKHLQRIDQQLKDYLKAQSQYQLQLERTQAAQEAGTKDVAVPLKPTPSHELSDYLFARSLLSQYQAQTGNKIDPKVIEDAQLTPKLLDDYVAIPNRSELRELWSAGVKEVFGRRQQASDQSTTQASSVKQQHHSFEINPVSIVFSKLPMLIRSRKFSQPISGLSSDIADPIY